MKILNIQAHRGPNVWSIQHPKLIQLRLEMEEPDQNLQNIDKPTLQKFIPGFSGLNMFDLNHLSLPGALAIVLQKHVGHQVDYLFTKATLEPNVYNILFEYQDEETGKYAAKLSVTILNAIIHNGPISVDALIKDLKVTAKLSELDPYTNSVIKLAKNRSIPTLYFEDEKYIQLGYGKNLARFSPELTSGKYPPEDKTPGQFLDSLFPNEKESRIPIIAITGTNGKTTTSRLTAHILQSNKINAGYTTSDGIYIGTKMVDKGDTTGPMSAQKVLGNNKVEVAVLECARGGIVRAGLGFDKCDIAIVTNIQEDHLGLADIHTLDELANAKGIIIDVLKPTGYAVCNANNEYSRHLGLRAKANHALFALDEHNIFLHEHIQKGGLACFEDNGTVTIIQNGVRIPVAHVNEIPITFEGRVSFMVENVLAASLACFCFGLNAEQIAKGLSDFYPSAEMTPGRLNIFDFSNFKVMVDFAHNPDGFRGIRDFMASIDSPNKIGIITGTGDRRDSDLLELGSLSAQMFDHIIISQRKFLRGRTAEEIVGLLIEGIKSHNPQASYEYIPDSVEPLKHALGKRTDNCFICALSDVLDKPLEMIPKFQGKEKSGKLG